MSTSPLQQTWDRLTQGLTWSRTLGISLVAIAVVAAVVLLSGRSVLAAIFTPGVNDIDARFIDPLLAEHAEATELAQRRFNGRSVFFMPKPPPKPPPPPPPPPPPEDPVEEKPTEPPPPPPPPSSYAGPKQPFSMLGDKVFFTDGVHLRVGEEDKGVKVLAVNPPWSATLAHKGGEYEVDVTFAANESLFQSAFEGESDTPGLLAPDDPAEELTATIRTPSVDDDPDDAGADDAARVAAERAEAGARSARGGRDEPAGDPEEGGNAVRTPEPVEIPAALSADQIKSLSRPDALKALSAVSRARQQPDLDEETKARLSEEFQLLLDRIKAK